MAQLLLKLYLVGGTPPSERAVAALDDLRSAIAEDVDIEVIDVRDDPGAAERERILATPLLMRAAPLPARRVIGDLSDPDRVLAGLGLRRRT
jgi:circadian clock protein KaiB